MKFIKNNIKLIAFVIILTIIVTIFIVIYNKEVNYKLEYDMNDYHVTETYYKDDNMYTFNMTKGDYSYDFSVNHKYTSKRKIINSINTFNKDNYECVSIKVFGNDTNTICHNGENYYDFLLRDEEENKSDDTFTVYNDQYDYLVWNGYGYTNKRTNENYNFLNKESYTNSLAYQFNEYIITPNYDQQRTFNKIYIYNNKKHTIDTWNLNVDISYDSYFLGNIGEDLYLFDVTNKIEYRMNIKRKKIKIATRKEMVIYYDGKKTTINKNKLIYNKILFKYDNIYNFNLFDNTLYYRYYKSDKDIRISNLKVKDIIHKDNENVYYLSDTTLYVYNIKNGEFKLAKSFEWNFDYLNKIYVFKR